MTIHARVHARITFANPFLRCDECDGPVPEWHDSESCGCDEDGWENLPCGHRAAIHSACTTWSPVGGCECLDALGRRVNHQIIQII